MPETAGIMQPPTTSTTHPSPLEREPCSCWGTVVSTLVWVAAFLVSWLAMTLIFTVNMAQHRTAYNSDLVHPFLLLEDLLADPTAIGTWQLSPAIYVFPDWLLAGLLVASPLPNVALPLVYGGFLLAAYGFAIGWMLVAARLARWPEAVVWGVLLIAGLFMASNTTQIGLGGIYLSFIATAYIHSGAIFAGLLLVPLLVEMFHGEGPRQQRARWLTAILVPLACYTDLVFVAWFAAPVCTAFLLAPTPMAFRDKTRFIGGLAGLSLLAAAIDQLRPSRLSPELDRNLTRGVTFWQELLEHAWARNQWQIWLPLGLMLVMVARGLWLTWPRRGRTATRADSLELAVIFATVSSVVLPFLAGALIHESKLRYVLPVMLLPWVWLLVIAARLNSPERRQGVLAAGVALCLGCLPFAPHVIKAMDRIDGMQKLRKTLEAHDLRAGYGDYWTAKPVLFETDRRVHCIPLCADGSLDDRNYNGRWFSERADGGGAIEPTFIVTSRLDPATLRKRFGEPAEIVKFKQDQFVWIYDEPLPLITPRITPRR